MGLANGHSNGARPTVMATQRYGHTQHEVHEGRCGKSRGRATDSTIHRSWGCAPGGARVVGRCLSPVMVTWCCCLAAPAAVWLSFAATSGQVASGSYGRGMGPGLVSYVPIPFLNPPPVHFKICFPEAARFSPRSDVTRASYGLYMNRNAVA
jgi:hypothetical protein